MNINWKTLDSTEVFGCCTKFWNTISAEDRPASTRSMIVAKELACANVSVLPLRVRHKTLPEDAESDWID